MEMKYVTVLLVIVTGSVNDKLISYIFNQTITDRLSALLHLSYTNKPH